MPLYHNDLGTISSGMNQLPVADKELTSALDMVNCIPTINNGLVKRNPQEFIKLMSNSYDSIKYTKIYKAGNITYMLVVGDVIEIINLESLTVFSSSNGNLDLSSLGGNSTLSGFRFTSLEIDDGLLLANTGLQVEEVNETPSILSQGSYVNFWIKENNYTYGYDFTFDAEFVEAGATHKISEYLNNKIDSSTSTSTEDIASTIASRLNAVTQLEYPTHKFYAESIGSVVRAYIGSSGSGGIVVKTGTVFSNVSISDSYGDTASSGWSDKINTVEDLPNSYPFNDAVGDTVVEVIGYNTNDLDNYFVKREDGVWVETFDHNNSYSLDTDTMPVFISAEDLSSGSLKVAIKPYSWVDKRVVGDTLTNKNPKFVGKSIQDLFYYNNRLGILTEDTVSFSEIDTYGNFFRNSVATLLDSDRITAEINSSAKTSLQYALPIDTRIVLLGTDNQFLLSSDNLTPSNFRVDEVSSYSIKQAVKPTKMGKSVFFPTEAIEYDYISRFGLDSVNQRSLVADNMNIKTPRLLDNIKLITSSEEDDMIFVVTNAEPTIVYCYSHLEVGGQLAHSAWFKWDLNIKIGYIEAYDGKLYISGSGFTADSNPQDWVLKDGVWDNNGIWYDDATWVDDSNTIGLENGIWSIDIQNKKPNGKTYLDATSSGTNSYISLVDLGEIPFYLQGKRNIFGKTQLKTISLENEFGEVGLLISDIQRNSVRIVDGKYTKGRKSRIGGNSDNIRLSLRDNSTTGFKIDNVTIESTYNKRGARA